MIKRGAKIALAIGLLGAAVSAGASEALDNGLELYRGGRWRDAIISLRQAASADSPGEAAEALYWIALAELASGDYEAALRDIDETARKKTTDRKSVV